MGYTEHTSILISCTIKNEVLVHNLEFVQVFLALVSTHSTSHF